MLLIRITDADSDLDPAFHFDADLDSTVQFDADTNLDPTTFFFQELYPPMLQNDPLRLPSFHFDADPDLDPAFTLIRIRIWIQFPKMMRSF